MIFQYIPLFLFAIVLIGKFHSLFKFKKEETGSREIDEMAIDFLNHRQRG